MVKKIDAESVAREDMPSYRDRSLLARFKKAIDEGHDPKNLPEMMRRKSAAETDVGKGEGIVQKLGSPYKTDKGSEYNKRNSATSANYNALNRAANKPSIADEINPESASSTRANSRAANREAIYGTQKSESSTPAATPDTSAPVKKPKAPVTVVKKQTIAVSKPKVLTEGQKAREQIARMSKIYQTDPEFANPEDENAYTKSVAGEESEYKKGGQIKRRPPKPAKKVPARKFASGGCVSRTSASKRGDGCATKGHTRGKYL